MMINRKELEDLDNLQQDKLKKNKRIIKFIRISIENAI